MYSGVSFCFSHFMIFLSLTFKFTLKPSRSKRHKVIEFADIEFADDIALLANSAIDDQTLLQTKEEMAADVIYMKP